MKKLSAVLAFGGQVDGLWDETEDLSFFEVPKSTSKKTREILNSIDRTRVFFADIEKDGIVDAVLKELRSIMSNNDPWIILKDPKKRFIVLLDLRTVAA